jgi:hypothetical protein
VDKNICCPKFSPKKWDKKSFVWEKNPFIKESVPALFHIPFIPMIGKKITKMWELTKKDKKTIKNEKDTLILFHDPNPFKSEMFLQVSGSVKGANNVSISGRFEARVFDGDYNDIPKFIPQMTKYLDKKGKKAKDYYIHYAYCPKCAKKYGHNYMILFAQVD